MATVYNKPAATVYDVIETTTKCWYHIGHENDATQKDRPHHRCLAIHPHQVLAE